MLRPPQPLKSFPSDSVLLKRDIASGLLVVGDLELRDGRWEQRLRHSEVVAEHSRDDEGDDALWLRDLRAFDSDLDVLRGVYKGANASISLPESSTPESFLKFVRAAFGCTQALRLQKNGAIAPLFLAEEEESRRKEMRPILLLSRPSPLSSALLVRFEEQPELPQFPVQYIALSSSHHVLRGAGADLLARHYLAFLSGQALVDRAQLDAWNAQPATTTELLPSALLRSLQNNADRVAVTGAEGSNLTYSQVLDMALRLKLPPQGSTVMIRSILFWVLVLKAKFVFNCLVCFSCTSSPEYVVAICACLLAGVCYVPVDPSYPKERLEFIARDCNASLVLDKSTVHALLGAEKSKEQRRIRAGDLAYVIYTSGSTGRPKGVCVEHAGILNMLTAVQTSAQIRSTDSALHFYGLGFDGETCDCGVLLCV